MTLRLHILGGRQVPRPTPYTAAWRSLSEDELWQAQGGSGSLEAQADALEALYADELECIDLEPFLLGVFNEHLAGPEWITTRRPDSAPRSTSSTLGAGLSSQRSRQAAAMRAEFDMLALDTRLAQVEHERILALTRQRLTEL